MEPGGAERHSDDELASAIEAEVSRATTAAPILAGPTVVGSGGDPAALSDDEVEAIVDEDLRAHDTLAAIDHLQRVLEARAATSAIPVQAAAEPVVEPVAEAVMAEPEPTQAISFDDLPVRRAPSGPEPTFSAWVGAAAPEPRRVEPIDLVPEHLAPRPSEPIPVVMALPEVAVEEPEPEPEQEPAEEGASVEEVAAEAPAEPEPAPEPPTLPPPAPRRPLLPRLQPEATDLEPSPVEARVGRAARMFWLWFAGTSSLISVGVGATLFSLGLSLRQLLVATLVGVALSFLPLGLGTLAGKWSGQPTMVVSRATFGLRGNALPAALALLTRLFWGAVLLWLAGSALGSLVTAEGWAANPAAATSVALAVTIGIAAVVAYFGYALVARVQLVLTIASAVLIAATVAATWRHIDLSRALLIPDALWTHVVTGAVLVFSYLGLAWAMSSAEVARYQRKTSSGAAAMLWATFGAAVPPFVLVSYGGLLAASDPRIADALASDPVSALVRLGLPGWFPVPLLLAVSLSLVSALVLTIYSAGFSLEAIGARLGRRWSTLVSAAAIAAAGGVLAATVTDLDSVIRGVPTALSVPVAAWAGIFSGELMLRVRRFHAPSLLRSGGAYPDWRWTNLVMLVVASVIGLGLVSSPLPWLAWEGYLFRLAGIDPHVGIGASNIGVAVALALGIATPIVSGLPAVRRQERAGG